jgi:hypothetical protein
VTWIDDLPGRAGEMGGLRIFSFNFGEWFYHGTEAVANWTFSPGLPLTDSCPYSSPKMDSQQPPFTQIVSRLDLSLIVSLLKT